MTTGVQELAKMIPQQWYDDKRISAYNNYMMDWYDADDDGTVTDGEKQVRFRLNRRTRSRQPVTRVR